MGGSTRPAVAMGISFLVHAGVVFSIYLLAPTAPTHAGILAANLNTRTGPPRSLHLTLWNESTKGAKSPVAIAVEESAPAQPPAPAPPPIATVPATLAPQPVMLPPSPVAMASNVRSDYEALTGAGAGRTRPGPSDGSSLGGGPSKSVGGLGLFKVPDQVRSVVFVMDGSASMGEEGAFDSAKRELAASIQALPAITRFQVIVYNKRATPLRINGHVDLVPATPDNKRAALALVHELDCDGDTDHVHAMKEALVLQPEAIIFVTDADGLRADQVHALTVFNHGRSAIHTIELRPGRRRDQSPLQILAEQNHGDFRVARAGEK